MAKKKAPENGCSPHVQQMLDAFTDKMSTQKKINLRHLLHAMFIERDGRLLEGVRAAVTKSWDDYLVRVTPLWVQQDKWLQLHGMWVFIGDYPHTPDHERIARAVRKELGETAEAEYRKQAADFLARVS